MPIAAAEPIIAKVSADVYLLVSSLLRTFAYAVGTNRK